MFSSSFSPNSISLKLSSSRKRGSILLFLLFLGIFLVGEKSWAVDCGEQYAGKYGTCKKTVGFTSLSCPDNWFSWSFTSSLATCASDEKCCIQETTCNTNWDECVFEGEKGLCENGSCIKNKTHNAGDPCGPDNLGTCYASCSTASGKLISYGNINSCNNTTCCIDECYNKTDGTACSKSDLLSAGLGTYQGTCKNKLCQNGLAGPGESCGSGQGGKCVNISLIEQSSCTTPPLGIACANPGTYTCCIDKPTPTPASGGTTPTPTISITPKPPANPDAAPKAFGYTNPLSSKTFTAWAEKVLTSIQGIVGWLAVIMIMIGGIVYLTSAGTKSATLGREIITAALIGFAAAVAGPSLLKEIKDLVSGTGTTATGAIDSAKDIKSIFTSALNFLLVAMGTLSLIGFVIGGFFYLTAFGDKSRAETGRKIATNSLYAIALAGGGLILVKQILSLLNK